VQKKLISGKDQYPSSTGIEIKIKKKSGQIFLDLDLDLDLYKRD